MIFCLKATGWSSLTTRSFFFFFHFFSLNTFYNSWKQKFQSGKIVWLTTSLIYSRLGIKRALTALMTNGE
jgi:hypothetical protein